MELVSGVIIGIFTTTALLLTVAGISSRSDTAAEQAEEDKERGRRDALAALRRAIRSHAQGLDNALARDLEEAQKALERAEG